MTEEKPKSHSPSRSIFNERFQITEALDLINTGIESKDQWHRIENLIEKQYNLETRFSKKKQHKHNPELCKQLGCQYMQREFNNKVYNLKKFMSNTDVVNKLSTRVNKVLVDHAFRNEKDRAIR